MADQPTNPGNDFASISGSYPTEPPAGSPAAPASPFVTESVDSGLAPQQAPPASAPSYQPPQYQPPADPFAAPYQAPTAPPPQPAAAPQATAADANNPFAFQTQAQQPASGGGKSSSGIKRLLALIFLLIGLGLAGFLGFTFVGKFLAANQTITLNYWGLWENEAVIKPIIDEYQKSHPKVKIVYTKNSIKQYRERIINYSTRADGPDIFRFHNTWVPMLKDVLAPAGKTGYSASEFKSTFYPVANTDLVVGGQVYGAPLMIDGLALYYNEDLLRAAGVTPPTTWEDFRTAALALTVKDNGTIVTAGAALGTANNIEHFSDIVALMMMQNGVNLKNPVGSEAQQALAFYRLFAEKPNNVWDDTMENSITAFANRKVAFIFAPSWEVFTIRELDPQLKFQIIPVPQLVGSTATWASYWVEGVSNKSKNVEAAWEFLKFLTTKESMVKIYTEEAKIRAFGEPYARVDLASTLEKDPLAGAYITQAKTAQSFPLASRTFDNGLNDEMINYLKDAINNVAKGVSGEAALTTMAQGFTQVMTKFSGKK